VYTFRLATRSLIARPLRSLLTTFAIMLGVGVILANSITNLSAMEAITLMFSEASGNAHLVVLSADTSEYGIPERTLRQVSDTTGVAYAIPSVLAKTVLADDLSSVEAQFGMAGIRETGLSLFGVDAEIDGLAREYQIVEGRFLGDDIESHELVLVKDYAEDKGIKLHADLDIVGPDGLEQLRVVGFMAKEGPGRQNSGAFGVVPLRTAQRMFGRMGELDQIDVVALPEAITGPALDQLKASIEERLGDKYSVIYPASRGRRVTDMLTVYQLGLKFFSTVALFVGAFLIYNAFSMTIVERTRETGLMRAVGMTRSQVIKQVMVEALILGLLGSALGFGFGALLAQGLIRLFKFMRDQDVTLVRVPLESLATSLAVGVSVALAAATIPAWQAGKITPLQALRVRGQSREPWLVRWGWTAGIALMMVSYAAIFLIPLPPALQYQIIVVAVFALFLGATMLIPLTVGFWERLFRPLLRAIYGNEGRLGSANIQRARSRTTLTAAALMVGVAMILGVRGLTGSFQTDITNWIGALVGGDLYITSSQPMRADLTRRLVAVDGVAAATPVRHLLADVIHSDGSVEPVAFAAIDPATHTSVTSLVFSDSQADEGALLERLAEGDAVFISSMISDKLGVNAGDIVRLKTKRGERDFEVLAVVVDYYNGGQVVQGSWKDLRRYFGTSDATMFLVRLEATAQISDVHARIEELYGERRHLTVDSNEELRTRVSQASDSVFSLFDALAMIAIVVAAFGVVNTLTMNVSERTRELGALRGLGMTRWQVGKMILAESAMIGIIGGAFGLAFGLLMIQVLLLGAAALQGYQVNFVLPVEGIIISVLLALLVSQLAALWPARRAAGLSIVEAIQYE